MDFKAEIREALRDFVREMLNDQALVAVVKSVDKTAGTIVATSVKEGVDYHDVRLLAQVPETGTAAGLLCFPVVGSQVVLGLLDGLDTMAYVSQCSAVEEYALTTASGLNLRLTAAGELLLNGDQYGELVKLPTLVQELNKTNAAVQAMMQAFQAWVVVAGDGGAALYAAMTTALAGQQLGDFSNLGNPNIKHG